jgi:hypothetical protein
VYRGHRFIEPCAGNGALVQHLEGGGLVLHDAFDIAPQVGWVGTGDALKMNQYNGWAADYIITNPPWDRKILHPMISTFSAILPTWLLFDADWMHTRQSAPFIPWLRKIVSVGRVKWIPDSKMTGKDNCAWYLFDQNSDGPTVFHGRAN